MPAAIAAIASVLLASGCSGASAGGGAARATTTGSSHEAGVLLAVTGAGYAFTPKASNALAGKTTIRFTNNGVVEHDFVIKALGIRLHAQPGKSAEVAVILRPGTYRSVCSVPGHLANGMQGTLTVR